MNHDPISRATPIGESAERRTGTGSLLRASRLRCGEELDVVAQVLRIRRRHLQAIEDGHFEELPGTTYAVGFIRAYADYLGLDSDEVVRRFKEENTLQPGRPPKADLVFPSPMSESGIPRGAVVFLGVLIGVIAYGGWYSSTVDNDFFKNWIEPVPQRLAALVSGGGDTGMPDSSQAVAADKPAPMAETAETAPEPAPEPGPETGQAPMPAATETPAAEPAAAETPAAETPGTEAAVAEAPAAATSSEESARPAGETAPAAENATDNATATETVDATPAPEPVATPAPETATAETLQPEAVRPPQSIAQPVETAELPAPVAEPATSETASSETASAETPVVATENSSPTPAVTETNAAAPTAAGTAVTEVASAPAIPDGTRIILTAISDSWVEVREKVTDAWVWGKLLRAGEVYPVPDRPNLKLKTGNAGGLKISVDGTDVPPVGDSGEVVRNVLLDPELLKAGTAVSR